MNLTISLLLFSAEWVDKLLSFLNHPFEKKNLAVRENTNYKVFLSVLINKKLQQPYLKNFHSLFLLKDIIIN